MSKDDFMKSVLLALSVFPPEPIVSANLMADLAEDLSKSYSVTVLRPHPTRPKGFKMPEYNPLSLPYKVKELETYTHPESSLIGRFRESISMGRVYARYIKEHHNEIDFIVNDAWHLFGYNKVAHAAVKYGIPYIVPVQDIYPESLASKLPDVKFLRWIVIKTLGPLDKYTLTHSAKIHTISDKMRDILSGTRDIQKDHFVIVRNWQDERPFLNCSEKKEANAPFTFMYLGNVGPLAGVDVLINAFEKSDLDNARLVIAGSGSAKEHLQEVAKGCKSQIEFWEVPGGMVPAIQAKADVMCLPIKKGFAMSSVPSKLPAYMFSAKPVLASVDAESDTARCINDANAGWVCEPESFEQLSNLMQKIVGLNKEELSTMGISGREFALKEFSRTGNLRILANACKAIINKQ